MRVFVHVYFCHRLYVYIRITVRSQTDLLVYDSICMYFFSCVLPFTFTIALQFFLWEWNLVYFVVNDCYCLCVWQSVCMGRWTYAYACVCVPTCNCYVIRGCVRVWCMIPLMAPVHNSFIILIHVRASLRIYNAWPMRMTILKQTGMRARVCTCMPTCNC